MSTSNMPDFFDNILDDAGPIGELPDLDQVPEFVDEEPNLSSPGHNAQTSHETCKPNSEVILEDQLDRPILVNPSDGGVLDKLDGEILSDGFPSFDFDATIRERDDRDIAFESALNEANDIGIEGENFPTHGERGNADSPNEADVHCNENADDLEFVDISCEEHAPLTGGAVKRRKWGGKKSNVSGNGPSPSKKERVESTRNSMNPRVSDVTTSSVTNRVRATSDGNDWNSPSLHRSLERESVGHVHLNNGPAIVRRQPLRANTPNNGGHIVPVTQNKPSRLTLASHVHPGQERSPVLHHDLMSRVSPLGMLPGNVRDQLLNQARRQSYAAAEMRALMMAQEAASSIYSSSSGDPRRNPGNPNMPISSAGMQPGVRLVGHPTAAKRIQSNSSNQSRQQSVHVVQPERQVLANQIPLSSHMHLTQMHATSKVFPPQAGSFSKVSSTDSHAKQMLLQQHPVAMGLSGHINNSNPKLPANADPRRLINNNGLEQPFSQTAPYPIIDTKLAAMNGIPTVGPGGMRRISKETRNSEAVAQTLANTYDQVNELSATTIPDGKASRKSQPQNREQIAASSSQVAPVPQSQYKPQQQVRPTAVAPTATPTTAEPTQSGLTAAAVRRQLSQNRNGPRLRFSKNAGPSKYCHICGRSASTVSVAVCGNLPLGLCRKVLCEKCLLIHEPEKLEMAKTKNSGWTCTHCRNVCPPKARCHQYTRNNQKRREKNDQKKRMKRSLQEQQEQQEQENKRRRSSCSEQPEEQGQLISPTGVPDGAFG